MYQKMYQMNFVRNDFNALIWHLNQFEEPRLLKKIKNYAKAIVDDNGEPRIAVRFFGDELRELCWYLMCALPEEVDEDYFSSYVQAFEERDEACRKRKEEKDRILYEGIKQELLRNPQITGKEIASNLHVSNDKVYAVWKQVRADIENEAKSEE